MLSIQEIKKSWGDPNMSDEKAEEVRSSLYALAEITIDLFENNPKLREKALKASKEDKLPKDVEEKLR